MYDTLNNYIEKIKRQPIPDERQEVLNSLAEYISLKATLGEGVNLVFICTHNSRRSQLAQVMAQTAADHYGVTAHCFSGGVEVTAFNERAVAALARAGFAVAATGNENNPLYKINYDDQAPVITAWSKFFDDPANPAANFAAVMTCADADENCPFIGGAEVRVPLRYDDPKVYDNTGQEEAGYDQRLQQIASEMFYVFAKIKANDRNN